MVPLILMLSLAGAVTATMFLSMRSAFFFFVFLYGVYPKFLSVGLGEQGFALTGSRAIISIFFLAYFARALLNSGDIARGLGRLRNEKQLITALGVLVLAKVIGTVTAGAITISPIAAFADEVLLLVFAFVLAVTYLQSVRDLYLLFACIAGSVLVNEIVALMELSRGGSVFHGVIEVAYELASERGSIEGRIRDGSYRIMGLTVNPLNLASILCISLPGLFTLAFRQNDPLLKAIGAAALIGVGPVLLGTYARAGIALAMLVSLAAIGFFVTRRFDRTLFTTTVFLAGSTAVFVMVVFGPEILHAIASAGGEQGLRSAESRILQYGRTLPVIFDHLAFGVGYARNYALLLDVGHMDGHYLRIIIQGGFVGLAAFVWAILRGLRLATFPMQSGSHGDLQVAAFAVRTTLLVLVALMLVYSQHNTAAYLALFLGAAVAVNALHVSTTMRHEPRMKIAAASS